MQISKEFLMEAVGLSLLVALLFISVQLFQRAVKVTTLLGEEQEQKILELEEYEIVKNDGLLLDGLSAISYIKRMINDYGLTVTVLEADRRFTVSERSEYAELRDTASEKYISPLKKYRCEVLRDENGVITGIILEKEGE